MRRTLVVVWCVVLTVSSLLAQSTGAQADPLTGHWAGDIVITQGESRQVAITLDLKFDGKSAVTGTISGLPNPGDVKNGTFDPKTGALKLELGRSDDPEVLLVFEGTVEKGSAQGRVNGDAGAGEFKLTKKAT